MYPGYFRRQDLSADNLSSHVGQMVAVLAPKLERELESYNGILVPGGFGKRGIEGMINAIEFARAGWQVTARLPLPSRPEPISPAQVAVSMP